MKSYQKALIALGVGALLISAAGAGAASRKVAPKVTASTFNPFSLTTNAVKAAPVATRVVVAAAHPVRPPHRPHPRTPHRPDNRSV